MEEERGISKRWSPDQKSGCVGVRLRRRSSEYCAVQKMATLVFKAPSTRKEGWWTVE